MHLLYVLNTNRLSGNADYFLGLLMRCYRKMSELPTDEQLKTVAHNLAEVLSRVDSATKNAATYSSYWRSQSPVLVAVSKTKHPHLVKACYDSGHREFGENYIQELEEKSEYLHEKCPNIRWHFIGQIQSNKIAKLAAVKSLYCVETLSSEKHCEMLAKELAKNDVVLKVLVQVNTSGEEQKGGVTPDKAMELADFIRTSCPSLRFSGFMTIGSFEESSSDFPNKDFDVLFDTRKRFCESRGLNEKDFDLSMGMSHDFETAIKQGSTSVRVGSIIFGPRVYAK